MGFYSPMWRSGPTICFVHHVHFGQWREWFNPAVAPSTAVPVSARGGLGLANVYNVAHLSHDAERRRGHDISLPDSYVTSLCTVPADAYMSPVDPPSYGRVRLAP